MVWFTFNQRTTLKLRSEKDFQRQPSLGFHPSQNNHGCLDPQLVQPRDRQGHLVDKHWVRHVSDVPELSRSVTIGSRRLRLISPTTGYSVLTSVLWIPLWTFDRLDLMVQQSTSAVFGFSHRGSKGRLLAWLRPEVLKLTL